MKELNFIGIGGATNIELGGNCAYLKEEDNLLVIDMCESATEKLKNINAFKNIKNIYIVITHTHFDHIAGLGVFIWYCNFYLNIIPKIIYGKEEYRKDLETLLTVTGVNLNYVKFIKDTSFKIKDLTLKLQDTSHSKELRCHGIMFNDSKGKYYYTGDTKDINYIKELINDPNIKTIYTEVSTETFGVHVKYDDISKFNSNKIIMMHFNTNELYKKAKNENKHIAKLIKRKK